MSDAIRKIRIPSEQWDEQGVTLYNLDVVIAVGYRVNSYEATQFRIWSAKVLKEYIVKGFALDDERLKGKTIFGEDYFDELLDRIREIRTSERRYYQKITDIYAECSYDYDKNSDITRSFYKTVQNMMHYAVTHQTERRDHCKELSIRTRDKFFGVVIHCIRGYGRVKGRASSTDVDERLEGTIDQIPVLQRPRYPF